MFSSRRLVTKCSWKWWNVDRSSKRLKGFIVLKGYSSECRKTTHRFFLSSPFSTDVMIFHEYCLSRLILLLLAILTITNSAERSIPVVYVSFGEFPLYLRLNIELAARNNDVIVLSDVENVEHFHWASNSISGISNNASASSTQPTIVFESLMLFTTSAKRFAPLYRHLSKDHSENRIKHELRCFQRWFILQDYMQRRNLSHAYFSDGDSSVFTSVSHVVKTTRANCSAVINIEAQFHDLHWVGAGEASVWTLPAIVDFCAFMQATNYIPITS